jgi:hypothetical protein
MMFLDNFSCVVKHWTIYEFTKYMNSTIIDDQFYINLNNKLNLPIMLSQMVLLCTISNDCMAPYWGPRGAYVMSYQANAILKT